MRYNEAGALSVLLRTRVLDRIAGHPLSVRVAADRDSFMYREI